jgi:hypothetical protein
MGYYLVCYRIVSGAAIRGLEQQWLKIVCVVCSWFTSTATTLSGQVNPEAIFKRWDSSGNRKIHLAFID